MFGVGHAVYFWRTQEGGGASWGVPEETQIRSVFCRSNFVPTSARSKSAPPEGVIHPLTRPDRSPGVTNVAAAAVASPGRSGVRRRRRGRRDAERRGGGDASSRCGPARRAAVRGCGAQVGRRALCSHHHSSCFKFHCKENALKRTCVKMQKTFCVSAMWG